jgi:DNA-binding winged helix-turn-helix (wHTH) protein
MIELMMLRKGQIITKEMFLQHLYAGMDEPDMKIVDVFICKARRKLSAAGGDGLIETVWGHGYSIRDPRKAQILADRPEKCTDRIVAQSFVPAVPAHSRPSFGWDYLGDSIHSRWAALPQQRVVRH